MGTALITGASSGIGLELARLFAGDGHDLVLVARREQLLIKVADELKSDFGVNVTVISKDLTLKDSTRDIYNQLTKAGTEISIVVNNAGFGAVGEFTELEYERQINMLNLNINALVSLSRLFLPGMLERNHGGILNVGSLAGFQPGPYASIYYATKAFVLSFTEGLTEELKGKKIKISCLAPGPTNTEFGEISGLDKSFLFKFGTMSAREVARQGYMGFKNGKTVVIPGFTNRLLPFLVRISPRILVRKITASLNKASK
ncbi:MAG: SDR family NAD(P)-dependent oxidoreductase [Thermodesulfobacteriota bacterium]